MNQVVEVEKFVFQEALEMLDHGWENVLLLTWTTLKSNGKLFAILLFVNRQKEY